MKCLYVCLVTVTVISAAVPKDLCETCVPTQDCPLFENLSYNDQLSWMEKFPCGSLPKTNNYEVPAGFASAAKGDYVCCSNNIWGIEKPDNFRPEIGHQSWTHDQYNRPDDYSNYNYYNNNPSHNLDDYNLNNYDRNKFTANNGSSVWFPDWNQDYNTEYSNNQNQANRSNDFSNIDSNSNNITNVNFANNDTFANNINHINNITTNDGSTIWFPDRNQNDLNADYWLTHESQINSSVNQSGYWQDRPDQDWNKLNTQTPNRTYSLSNITSPTNHNIYYAPGNIERPYYGTRPPLYDRPPNFYDNPPVNIPAIQSPVRYTPPTDIGRAPNPGRNYPQYFETRPPTDYYPPRNIDRFPTEYIPPTYKPRQPDQYVPPQNVVPPTNIGRLPDTVRNYPPLTNYIPPNNIDRFPTEYNPPTNRPNQYYPPENVARPDEYLPPRAISRPPIQNMPPRDNVMPRQPFITNPPRKPDYNYNPGRRIDRDLYNTQPPFYSVDQGNVGGGQCRLTSFPPSPQSNCCGRQLDDDERITGRSPLYNRPASTNHWDSYSYRPSGPIWRTRREISENNTDEDVTVERRISGGQATELYQYPWTVLLLTTFDYGNRESSFNCGGSLISAKYVLSAGHCIYDKDAAVKSVQVNLAEYDKRTFPKDCKSTRNGRRCIENLVMHAEEIITHPEYQNENLINDIALIRLRGNAPYTEYIRPICLPSINIDEPQFSNLQFEVAGWGRNGPYSSDVKQSTFLHLTDHNQCRRYYPQLTNKHLCAAGQRGADTCKGDSGGPLMILYRGRYYVTGIVSGKRADSPCGTSVPSLYTNVYHYVDWIRKNMKN